MNYYQFYPSDQGQPNWLIHRPKQGGPGFVPSPDYSSFVCQKCRKFSHDAVFEFGFPTNYKLKLRGDIAATFDGFLCVNERVIQLIGRNSFPGLRYKQVDPQGWYVINIIERVETTSDVYKVVRGPCEECGRNRELIGGVHHMGQLLSLPRDEGFFSTSLDWECSRLDDRTLFMSSAVVECFKQNAVRGGALHLLHTKTEYDRMQNEWKTKGRCKEPKESKIVL